MNPHTTPWHRSSWDRFLHRRLPALLAERLGLSSFRAEATGEGSCRVVLGGRCAGGPFEVCYDDVPAPDEEGVFLLEDDSPTDGEPATPAAARALSGQRYARGGRERVVPPVADRDDLASARIDCVGERLLAFIDARLGQLPAGVDLDESLVRTLVPLPDWVHAFLAQAAHVVNGNNWLDRAVHLRRLLIPERQEVFTPGHFGRVCPFETPEGPNIGLVLTISRGADIRDGQLVVVDDAPVAGLGIAAACVPFLEHDDGNRVLMGVNMMRQWLPPAEPEDAFVQTGLEPDVDGFWCGRNLLTAFVSWDGDAFEDAVLVSETGARKLACPEPLEPGDKLANRHGIKGVVSRVVPDDDMPRLPDGTPVELVFSVSGIPSRWVMGQVREAALSHAARRDEAPAVVPPFGAPSDDRLRQRLDGCGLREDGMTVLTVDGAPLRRPSTAGWVYWGCTVHLARHKLRAATRPGDRGQRLGSMEVQALRDAGAPAVIQELTNTCSDERSDAATLADRLAAGPVTASATPSPVFEALAASLARTGIRVHVEAGAVAFAPRTDAAPSLELAAPVAHPWLLDETLSAVDAAPGDEGYDLLLDANARLARLLRDDAPEPLTAEARQALTRAVAALYDGVLSAPHTRLGSRVLFSGRAVIVPDAGLAADELGLPADMAWTLFGPQVERALGDRAAVERRSEAACAALAEALASSWIVLTKAPAVGPTSVLAFRPVRTAGRALRLCPLACRLLDADFDGDQAAVFLPLTEAARQEAGERLSIAGHLARDPSLVDDLFPRMDALFGLACLSRTAEGCARIAAAAGVAPQLEEGILTGAGVARLLRDLLARRGAAPTLRVAQELMRMGFAAARREGASIGPFIGATLSFPPAPADDDVPQWQAYFEELQAIVASLRDYDDDDMGAACLLSQCGARATTHQLTSLVGPGGLVFDVERRLFAARHGWREGLTAREVLGRVVGARRGLARAQEEYSALGRQHEARTRFDGFGVLSRARRVDRPGIVYARAARRREVDPLREEYWRLFVGLWPVS